LYVVVEFDPDLGQHHVLFPRYSMSQVHQTLQLAMSHHDWYVEAIYVEDPDAGYERVTVYEPQPVRPDASLPT
jgi:hypothetical protein